MAEPLVSYEGLLQLVGAFIALSVGLVSLRGYRATGSPTLLRLFLAFILLSASFGLSGVMGLVEAGFSSDTVLMASLVLLLASMLETVGYFFLAFSHAMDVIGAARGAVAPMVVAPFSMVAAAFKSLSIYLLLYGTIETIISYNRERKVWTLVIGCGLALVAVSELLRWVSLFFPESLMAVFSLGVRVVGLSTLFTPVMRFSLSRGT